MSKFVVGTNMPGYMPDSEPWVCESWEEAKRACLADLDYSIEAASQMDSDDYPQEDHIKELEETKKRLENSNGPTFQETVGNRVYWIQQG